MRRTLYHIVARFYEARSVRTHKKFLQLKEAAEKFFLRRDQARK